MHLRPSTAGRKPRRQRGSQIFHAVVQLCVHTVRSKGSKAIPGIFMSRAIQNHESAFHTYGSSFYIKKLGLPTSLWSLLVLTADTAHTIIHGNIFGPYANGTLHPYNSGNTSRGPRNFVCPPPPPPGDPNPEPRLKRPRPKSRGISISRTTPAAVSPETL